jgi:hypothetical protein
MVSCCSGRLAVRRAAKWHYVYGIKEDASQASSFIPHTLMMHDKQIKFGRQNTVLQWAFKLDGALAAAETWHLKTEYVKDEYYWHTGFGFHM